MPAQRKPEGQRLRRNVSTFDHLPLDGYSGPIPDWPLVEATEAELFRWERLWRSAQAAQWVRMHIDHVIARYVRLSLIVEDSYKGNVNTAQMVTAVTSLEDRLGLSAKALQNLSWVIVAEPETPAESGVVARRRISVVEPEAG